MPGDGGRQTCSACGAEMPRNADACPECGARVSAQARREFVLYDPFAKEKPAAAPTSDVAKAAAAQQRKTADGGSLSAPPPVGVLDGTLDLTGAAAEVDALARARAVGRSAEDERPLRRRLLRRFMREDGAAWNPLTWVARIEGWAIRRQIRKGRRYVRVPGALTTVVELDREGMRSTLDWYRPEMSPFSVAYANLIPGVGNLWLRQPFRAAGLALGAVILLIPVVATWTSPSSNVWIAALAALMVFSYDCAAKNFHMLRREDYSFSQRSQMLLLLALSVAGAFLVLGIVPFYWSFRVENGRLAPYLRQGERALYNRWAARIGWVRRGDVLYYRPRRFGFIDGRGRSGNVVEQRRIGRVLAVAGDTVEIRDRVILVNGGPPGEGVLFDRIKPSTMPPRRLGPRQYWVLYGNVQAADGIAAYAGPRDWAKEWDGLPEGARLHAETGMEACVVEKRQIIGVLRAVLMPPDRRRRLE